MTVISNHGIRWINQGIHLLLSLLYFQQCFPDYELTFIIWSFYIVLTCKYFVRCIFLFFQREICQTVFKSLLFFRRPSPLKILSNKTETTAGVHGFSRRTNVSNHWDFASEFCEYLKLYKNEILYSLK